ncbi:MAG: Gfo/Idh/MocA family protein, partial [Planctomycetota bacterium]
MGTEIEPINQSKNANDISRRSFMQTSGAMVLATAAGILTQAGKAWPAGSAKKIRMAVVGGGFGSGFHWHEHPNCVVTGVTDLIPARRQRLQNVYKCDTAYDSLEEMIKKAKNIDAIGVFTGAPDHAKHVKMCMENGWHVCSAVPACITMEEAYMMKELKEKTGLKYMMAESSYYRAECIFARNMYDEGGFGKITYSEVEYYHHFADLNKYLSNGSLFVRNNKPTWRWGIPPMLYPTHSLGYLTGVTKERITKVSSLGWGDDFKALKKNQYDNNPFWNEASMMRTSQGHICRCNVFWNIPAGGERAQWFGEKAAFYMGKGGVHGPKLRLVGNEHKGSDYNLPKQKNGDA